MNKPNPSQINNIDKKYQLFSNVSDILKYREQAVSDANHHSSEMVSAVKYYTTLISALFSLLITLTIACLKLFFDNPISIYQFLFILIIIFVPISMLIILLCGVALENSERLYRRTMEYVSIKMKIDEILGIHKEKIINHLREKFELKLFNKDTTFAYSEWEEKQASRFNIFSKDFVDELVKNDEAGCMQFSKTFIIFKNIGYILFTISIIFLIAVILPLICPIFC